MGEKFLIDTNILIYYLNNTFKTKTKKIFHKVLTESFNISLITKIELLSFPKLSKDEENTIRGFLTLANIISIDENIVERTIKIKRKLNIKMPDAIIASSAIEYNLTLMTRNVNDFNKISDLKVINPFD